MLSGLLPCERATGTSPVSWGHEAIVGSSSGHRDVLNSIHVYSSASAMIAIYCNPQRNMITVPAASKTPWTVKFEREEHTQFSQRAEAPNPGA